MQADRKRFGELYDSCIVGGGFAETDEYYRLEKRRYWRCLNILCSLGLPPATSLMEIGGGQLAVLHKLMFGSACTVADVTDKHASAVTRHGVEFLEYNLLDPEAGSGGRQYDAVLLLEVIEHIPLPGYVVLQRIRRSLKPGGVLLLTTPNLFRIRNLVRMVAGTEFLDRFQLPQPGQGLGHQLEYSLDHLRWQIREADMEIVMSRHDELGHVGHSPITRLGRSLLAPFRVRPIWRDGLVAVARRPAAAAAE